MKKPNIFTALTYYLTSLPKLFKVRNFWMIPVLLFKKPILFTLNNGLKFYLQEIMDIWVIKEVIFDKHYEKIRELKTDDIIVDIGAAFGDFSIYSSKKARRVFAYDPIISRIEIMKKNMALNGVKNITIYPKAVESLDKVFEENNIKKCNFLKIDCEGNEYPIMERASSVTLNKIEYMTFEIHLFDEKMKMGFEKLKNKLVKNKFKIREFNNPVHPYLKLFFALKE